MLKFFYYGTYVYSSCSNAHAILFILTKMQRLMKRCYDKIYFYLAFSPCHHYIYVFTTAWFSPKVANYVNCFRNKRGLLEIKKDKSSYFLFLSNNLILLVSINTRVVNRCIQYFALYSHFNCPQKFLLKRTALMWRNKRSDALHKSDRLSNLMSLENIK